MALSWLAADGHEGFLDADLHAGIAVGEQWQSRLYERLRWADAVVCLITEGYLASTWCAAEVGVAVASGSRLLPLRARWRSAPTVSPWLSPVTRRRTASSWCGCGTCPTGVARSVSARH
jgi:hypothetical protein